MQCPLKTGGGGEGGLVVGCSGVWVGLAWHALRWALSLSHTDARLPVGMQRKKKKKKTLAPPMCNYLLPLSRNKSLLSGHEERCQIWMLALKVMQHLCAVHN